MALPLVLAACGSSYDTKKIKDYRLALVSGGDTQLAREFKSLVADFNAMAGLHVLTYVDDPAQANSAIIVTEGLQQRDGKVGWGQWMSETRSENPATSIGHRPKRTVEYSMRLEFDRAYFKSRQADDAETRRQKQILFFHETGHGLEMDHNVPNDCKAPHTKADERNVMFCDVNGEKDLEPFFQRVRAYMADRD